MKKVLSLKGLAMAAISGLVIVGALAGGSVAMAADEKAFLDTGTPGPFQGVRNDALENFYKRAQLVVQEQQLRIDLANEVASAADTWIATKKSEGVDTSALEAALADFKSKIAAAQTEHDAGASVLNAHAGFDGSGNVTDAAQAHTTLEQTRDHLRTAHEDLRDATVAFRQAVRSFRQANHTAKNTQPK